MALHTTLQASTHPLLNRIIRHSKTDPRVGWSRGRDDERNAIVWLHGIAGCVAHSISHIITADAAKFSKAVGRQTYKERFLLWASMLYNLQRGEDLHAHAYTYPGTRALIPPGGGPPRTGRAPNTISTSALRNRKPSITTQIAV